MDEESESAYDILGVDPKDPTKEIRSAYIRLAQKWHPDLGTGTEQDIRMRTVKMYKLNAAKDILLDDTKRAKHDQDLKDRQENGVTSERDRGTGYRSGFQFSKKPRPSGLGVPYQGGRTKPETHTCPSDGEHGQDGHPGTRGFEGRGCGGHGTRGGNAGPATSGTHARDMEIHLRVTVAHGGFFEVDIHYVRRRMNELVDPTQNDMRSVPLKVFGTLAWSARGGKGGAGKKIGAVALRMKMAYWFWLEHSQSYLIMT